MFFFQAEDGIRDVAVTGVQTCALPILSLLAAGLAAGLVLSFALMWVLSSLLFAVRPYDPVSLGAAAAALALVALVACSIPAWRATRSEEHTSELQSRLHLVCRPLLGNKN